MLSLRALCWQILLFPFVQSKTIQSAYSLYDDLITNYTADIRPVNDDTEVLYVNTSFYLNAILDLDEPTGQLTTALSISLVWNDVLLTWNPNDYEGRYKMEVSKTKIWTPNLVLISPSQKTQSLGKDSDKISVYSIGIVTMSVIDIFNTMCSVDVTYFPYDTQVCDISFSLYEYGDLIRYPLSDSTMKEDFFMESGVWKVEKTEVYSTKTSSFNYDLIAKIHLKRRSTFYALNLLCPILILMLLNCMVFLLPADSGERVGFTVTILLAVSVYMTIISDKLPETSKPVSVLTYILVTYLAQSSLICVSTIYSLRLYHREDETPVTKTWCSFVRFLKCSYCLRRRVQHNGDHLASFTESKPDIKQTIQHSKDMSWKTISVYYDRFVFALNVFVCILVAFIYMCIIAANT